MTKFKDLQIRVKLIVLLGASAAIALSISALMSITLTFVTQRSESMRNLHQLSDIASENLTAALAFNDNVSAKRMLDALRANPQIKAAVIHDEQMQQFSIYFASNTQPSALTQHLEKLMKLPANQRSQLFDQHQGLEFMDMDFMVTLTPITFDSKTIGTLTIVSDNQVLKEKITYYVVMQTLISVFTLVVIFFISIRLQKVFTSPIFHLIDVIREVAQTRNYSVSVLGSRNDEFKALYSHFNDMLTEIRERDQLLSRLATTDPLTGLANRRHAMEIMQTMVTRASRKQESFGLVMFDIDHFKRINDQFGHPVGDVVLKEIAAILARMAREYDLVARIGGEEFLILCDNSDIDTVWGIAERMRMAIEAAEMVDGEGKILKVTASAGVFATVPASDDLTKLLNQVDDALYHAKENGRNQVSTWGKA